MPETAEETKVTEAQDVELTEAVDSGSGSADGNLDLLLDISMSINVNLGSTQVPIRRLLQLGPGSVIELDKLIGEPVDLLVNDKLIAKGEVVVFDENFGIRITDIINPEDRLKSLR